MYAYIPPTRPLLVYVHRKQVDSMESNAYFKSLSNWRIYKHLLELNLHDVFRKAELGELAPNTKVWSRDGKTQHEILDWQIIGRPLVLNFGSCS